LARLLHPELLHERRIASSIWESKPGTGHGPGGFAIEQIKIGATSPFCNCSGHLVITTEAYQHDQLQGQ
jgi:hypothetical protein